MLAVMNGHRDSVMLLLDQAANPNAVDINGRTAAHRGVIHHVVFLTSSTTPFLNTQPPFIAFCSSFTSWSSDLHTKQH